ncbi:peptidylprolyl isomerase [uncultured Roseobacter sp.]|uniref:peptidylprolyl isomerase n=1 Tax=uncultured Roseobacter sp. TaxID=114847 RepID=UPI00263837C4|nr:peptidylprolyl isomerase [uncultured Roseobacter sp.]
MHKHLRPLAGAALSLCLALPGWAQDTAPAEEPTAATVLATVNGEEITLGHVIAARETLPEQYNNVPADELYNGILQQLIQQTALAQNLGDQLPLRLQKVLENEVRSRKAFGAITMLVDGTVTEEEIQALYDEQFGSIDPEEEYNASHILLKTEEEAIAVKEALDGGADFAVTARDKSTGPSGPNGGQLGWFGAGMMVPDFEAATIALGVGEISDPVQTQFGWHIIRLNDARETAIPTLEDVRDQLTAELENIKAQEIISTAPEDADVQMRAEPAIDPELVNRTDLLD